MKDNAFFKWMAKTYPEPEKVSWPKIKADYADYLVGHKTKRQIWNMLCGPRTGPCKCECICMPGMAWNKILEKEENHAKI